MKQQTWIILTLVFALIIAIFAVINVDAVEVDFLFIQTEAPLILVILLSALLGCLAVASVTYAKFYQLKREIKQLKGENEDLKQRQEDPTTLPENESQENTSTVPNDMEKNEPQEEDTQTEQKSE